MVNERKSIAQILAERRAIKEEQQIQLDLGTQRQQALQEERCKVIIAEKQKVLDALVADKMKGFKLRWGLEQHIQDISEYLGGSNIIIGQSNVRYPGDAMLHLGGNTPESIDYSIKLLQKNEPGLTIMIYSGDNPGYYPGEGKCIRFVELDNKHLMIVPGLNWSKDSCPTVSSTADISDACLHVLERGMENWRKDPPENITY